jgi:protein O-GlcNAc transferase
VAYHNSRHFDEVSERLKSHTHQWVPCESMGDDELLKHLRADGIDVLIDLSGTTADGRSEVFAQRAAPVQVSYLGYPTTTGIPAMDFRISDPVIDPPGHEPYSTETVLHCASGMFCYRPDSHSDVGEPAHRRNGFVTFGSFNNIPKYSDQALALWSEVLKEVPHSRLLLKTKALGDPKVRDLLLKRFAQIGIGCDRLLLNPYRPDLLSHLELYREVDIALDTYPYNGATTTCEALWAGVPVVTLQGQTHTSRMGASILTSIGRTEWIAVDAKRFVEIAATLAAQPAELASFRENARAVMRASPLMDGVAHTRNFEDLLFQAWQARIAPTERCD